MRLLFFGSNHCIFAQCFSMFFKSAQAACAATALTLLSRKMDALTLARISRHKDLNILMQRYYRETAESISARL